MGVKIVVNTSELLSAARAIQNEADEYKHLSDSMFSQVGYLGSNWQGSDNVAFVNQIEGFRDDFQQMINVLTQYGDILRVVDNEYKRTLETNKSIAEAI